MKKLSFGAIAILLILNSCGGYGDYGDTEPDITSPVIISNTQHHVGDNTGSEGLQLLADFYMPSSFTYAELDITFVYPDDAGTSGPDVDDPPKISINGTKIGVYTSDFTQFPDCITEDRDFHCTVTLTYDITDVAKGGVNKFKIESVAYWNNGDDFTFSDVVVNFQ